MKKEVDKLNATPFKRTFHSIIADYDLNRSICELVDNGLDVWVRGKKAEAIAIWTRLSKRLELKTMRVACQRPIYDMLSDPAMQEGQKLTSRSRKDRRGGKLRTPELPNRRQFRKRAVARIGALCYMVPTIIAFTHVCQPDPLRFL